MYADKHYYSIDELEEDLDFCLTLLQSDLAKSEIYSVAGR